MLKPTNMEQTAKEILKKHMTSLALYSEDDFEYMLKNGNPGIQAQISAMEEYAAPLRTEIERLTKESAGLKLSSEHFQKNATDALLDIEKLTKEIERLKEGITEAVVDFKKVVPTPSVLGTIEQQGIVALLYELSALLTPSEKGMKPEETEVCESCGKPHVTESMVNEPENANWFCQGCVNEMTEKGGRE